MNPNSQLYVVPELSTTFQQWLNLDTSFIASKIFPEVMVDSEMFYIWQSGFEHLTIPSSTVRFGRAKANEATFSRNTKLMGPINEHALSSFITKRMYDIGGTALSVENQVVEGIASEMTVVDEKALADTLSNTGIITHYNTLSGTNQWSDHANSNPFNDITTMVLQQNSYSPMPANSCWLPNEAWLQIVNHPDFLARLSLASDRVMTQQGFLSLLAPYGIENVYIGKAKYNTAAENQTKNLVPIWAKNFWIGYITQTPGVQQINGGYKFTLTDGRYVTKEPSVNPMGNELIDVDTYDYELISADVYAMLQNVVA